MKVVVADWGAGNVRSVQAALERAGAQTLLSRDPAAVREAPLVVLAGVGHVATAARGLAPLEDVLRGRAADARPVLGICVGLQVLCGESDEGGCGFGLLGGAVRRLRARRVPHMGWNELRPTRPSGLLDGLAGADVYFAHSYAVERNGAVVATVEHDGPVVAAVESGALAGVQFHPERSGAAGARLLANALAWSRSA